jgi:alpha-glucosidase (family GH31 glycosyl hydrolase)
MEIILRPKLLQYRILGGTLDLTFLNGPTPLTVTAQYSSITGKPAKMPYWSFGFHLCRWGYKTVQDTKWAVEKMESVGVPLETIWNDLDYMDRFRNWEVSKGYK